MAVASLIPSFSTAMFFDWFHLLATAQRIVHRER
jgi:hypothetical protein